MGVERLKGEITRVELRACMELKMLRLVVSSRDEGVAAEGGGEEIVVADIESVKEQVNEMFKVGKARG